MSESGDYEPAAHWGGHDFASARKNYDNVVRKSFDDAKVKKISPKSLIPDKVLAECERPLVIGLDVSGSMGAWSVTIGSKLPYLEHEGKEYLGDDMQISFAAIGDATSDDYPLQVRPFVDGKALKTELDALVHEGNGGGNMTESYDLAALYYSKHCEMPEAIGKPIFIFIGDEGIVNYINKDHAKQWANHEFAGRLDIQDVFEELQKKFSVYVIRKPYSQMSGDHESPTDAAIRKQWAGMIGDDHVVNLNDPNRVVDVIFGILAKETSRIDYFEKELIDRQMKDSDGKAKIDVVLKSLHHIHKKASKKKIDPPGKAKSISKASSKGSAKSISLMDDDDE